MKYSLKYTVRSFYCFQVCIFFFFTTKQEHIWRSLILAKHSSVNELLKCFCIQVSLSYSFSLFISKILSQNDVCRKQTQLCVEVPPKHTQLNTEPILLFPDSVLTSCLDRYCMPRNKTKVMVNMKFQKLSLTYQVPIISEQVNDGDN